MDETPTDKPPSPMRDSEKSRDATRFIRVGGVANWYLLSWGKGSGNRLVAVRNYGHILYHGV